jgi:diguanylate cyclase (GGDEF)-like protein
MDVTELERLALSEETGIQVLAGATGRGGKPSGVMASVSVDGAGPQLVQFIDRTTGEVVIQMAPESVLRLVEQLVDQLQHRSRYDELTGLANRSSAVQQLTTLLAAGQAEQTTAAVLFCDVDDFKVVNDSVGHEAGDQVLRAMAQRMSSCLRSDATVFRANGDEFIVLVQGESDERKLTTLASRLVSAVEQPFGVHGKEVFISMSVGFAVGRSGEIEPDLLLRHADLALRQAKALGKGRCQGFDPSMLESILQRVELETELRQAMETGQVIVHYQPKLDLRTGSIAGVEALVRWDHPQRGIVPPNDFVPVAEQCGLIWRLGQFVLVRACNQVKQWEERFGLPLTVAVNVSPRQLSRPAFAKVVEGALASSGLPADRLVLEITEGSLIGTAGGAQAVLVELKRLGVQLSIDDFGTGYSSLDRLRSFPVDEMKIDKSFVQEIGTPNGDSLVAAMVGMGSALGHRVVAEGVETHEQLAFLQDRLCDHVQGYLVSRPVTAEALEVLLRARRGKVS